MDNYRKLDPSLSYSVKKYETKSKPGLENLKRQLGIASEIGNPKPARIVVFIECDETADFTDLAIHDIMINQKRGKVRTAFSPLHSIPHLEEDSRIKKIRASKYLNLEMDVAQVAVNVPQFVTSTHLTGKGVIIGIVDSGIDPIHPAFKGRILRIWDQTLSGPGVLEGGYGVEVRDTLLSTSRDRVGHGTHVAGIAAGADDSPYKGIARGSNLVIVKSDLKDTSIADGVRYIFRIANEEKSPCVINLSLGGHGDAHDGSDDLSRIIDEQSGNGSIVCCAAGNEGLDDIHSQTKVTENKSSNMKFRIPPDLNPEEFIALNAWYSGDDEFEVAVKSPSGFKTPYQGIVTNGDPKNYSLLDAMVTVITPPNDITNNDHNVFIVLESPSRTKPIKNGLWELEIVGKRVSSDGRIDSWILDRTESIFFVKENVSDTIKIGSPGSAKSAITVGSYTTKVSWDDRDNNRREVSLMIDDVSEFSNEGPLRDGTEKPELLAPGAMIASALSRDSEDVNPAYILDEHYIIKMGTSMATPFVTGVIALLLEKNRTLTPTQAKDVLKKCCSIPGEQIGAHNVKWGYGLLDVSRINI